MKLVELAFFTDDVKGMVAFYRRLLGSDPVAESEDMAIFQVGGTRLFIHRNYVPSDGELAPEAHFALAVGELERTCERLIEEGLALEVPPTEFYWGRSAYLRDPDGHQIEIAQS